jgi:hypothetical protein
MKTYRTVVLALSLTICAQAEMRIWNSLPGKTVEAEYVRVQLDNVVLRNADGKEIKVPLTAFSGEDKEYIELANPPELSVDVMRGSKQTFVDVSVTYPKDPLIILTYEFGARVKQKDTKSYNYPLTVEVYAFSQQRYDPSKYHLLQRTKSKPFVLNSDNGRRYEFTSPKKNRIIAYELYVNYLKWREARGEKFAETLVLVRDKRDEIIAYNSTKKWLYNNLERLEELPVGAWLNDDCIRVHPTTPKSYKDTSGAGFLAD